MELAMSQDYKEKYFDEKFKNIDAGFERLEKVISENTKLTREVKESHDKLESRVQTVESELTGEVKKKDLPPFFADPIVKKTMFILACAFLALIIAATQVDITEIIK